MSAKEILLVTNYFPPEKGAASNRMYSLAKALQDSGFIVHIVCPKPNYPTGQIFEGYKDGFYKKTTEDNLITHRLWLWASNSSNKFLRLLSMLSFSFSLSLFFLFRKNPKTIFIQYSPVFVGFTAVFWSWLFRKKRILNVSDLWPLAGLEMGLLQKGLYYSILERMERFCYRKSSLIVGQSEEILSHVNEHCKTPTFLYRNIPDFIPPTIMKKPIEKPIKLVYAGLLGLAQGLAEICHKLKLPDNIELHIYGSGPEAGIISDIKKKNIIYHGEVDRNELHEALQQYDIAFIPLTNRIYGSVPSKIFEYTRLGLPVAYFAGGEGGYLVEKHQLGWNIPVSNFDALQDFIISLDVEKVRNFPKEDVMRNAIKTFNFKEQFKAFHKEINNL